MKTAPTNWTTIVNSGAYTYECKVEIAGSTIYQSAIYSLSVSGSAIGAEPASIGAALSGEIDLSISILDSDNPSDDLDGGTFIWTDGDSAEGGSFWSGGDDISGGFFDRGIYIPPMAYIEPYIRVKSTVNTNTSGWVKIGKYFIDTREKDVKSGKFTCHGYDAMLKAEQNYYASVSSGSMTTAAVVSEIATLIGVGVDTATTTILTTTSYDVPYYAGQYSAREILGYIGAAYCGSFIIDDNNNLRLVRLVDYGTNTNIGARARSFELSEQVLTYDKVTVVIDPTHEWTAGSGNSELVFDCPFGTQAMANAVLSALSQYAYRGYSAGTAIITPLYDLGDSVTIKGTTVQIFNRTLRFNNLMASDLSVPYDEEINHEYVYKTATERKIERFQENVQSEFAITASEIASKVSQTDFNGNEIVSKINQTSTTISMDANKIDFSGKDITMTSSSLTVTATSSTANAIKLGYGSYYTSHTSNRFYVNNNSINQVQIGIGRNTNDVWFPSIILRDTNGTARIYAWADETAGDCSIRMKDANNILRFQLRTTATSGKLFAYDGSETKSFELGHDSNDTDVCFLRIFTGGTQRILLRDTGLVVWPSGGGQPAARYGDASTANYTKGQFIVGDNSIESGYQFRVWGKSKATAWDTSSQVEYKTNINPIDFNVFDVIDKTDIYSFEYKEDVANGVKKTVYGPIIGDGYKCDESVLSADETAVSTYSMTSLLWQAVKELKAEVDALKGGK